MDMTNEQAINILSKVYKEYFLVSKDNKATIGADEYALESAKGYIDYIESCKESYPHWTTSGMVQNEIRIIMGLIECYAKRDFKIKPKVSNKTRWSL